jgi:hypothetical protein
MFPRSILLPKVLSCVLVTEMGFGLVIGFINHLQVVTTINYNTPRQSSQSDLLFPSVLQVPIRTLVRLLLPWLLFTHNYNCHCIHFSSSWTLLVWNWTIWNITSVALYRLCTDHAQKTRFYCCARNIVPWTSHMTPCQYCWSVTSCAYVEVCLPGHNLETDCVTPQFHCWYL